MDPKFFDLPATVGNVTLRAARGHFATRNSHINYFIDVTAQKYSTTGAASVAQVLAGRLSPGLLIDTILCMDGTSVIGTQLANRLLQAGYRGVSENGNMFVLKGEPDREGHLIFRDNAKYMLEGKRVLLMMASLTTGTSALQGKRSIEYYGGHPIGVAAIYSSLTEIGGLPVISVYDCGDLTDYASYAPAECPLCKRGIPIDAVINTFGYSKV